ncbi:MAG: N-acetylneuraminate synthase family protein [Vicinamibacteria bacterium]|nr:N-acetylneuraminate synthase family protein [Vicinamibacteria bacterium]
MQIEGRRIGADAPCFVIAEVGVNHNGDVELARRMIDMAAECGADCVKFQTFRADEFVNDTGETYEYESQGRRVRESMLDMFRRLELPRAAHEELFAHARRRGLVPLSTPADVEAVDLLVGLGAGAVKIGSDDLVHAPLLRHVARTGLPVILSSGMAAEADVARAISILRAAGARDVALLHCVSEYPAPAASLNLRKIAAYRERFAIPIGFSDHSDGITGALGAVALGACIVEKHVTLSRDLPGPDHRFSADPAALRALVAGIREMEQALGSPRLVPTPAEAELAALCHRSIVAARDLPAGHVLAEPDLAYRRPATGLKPYQADEVLGRALAAPLARGALVLPASLAAAAGAAGATAPPAPAELVDPVWERKYSAGHAQRWPWDAVVTFVMRNAPRGRPRHEVAVLEVGCGTGANLAFAAREGFAVMGVDGSPSAIARARERFAREGFQGDLQVADFTALPFADGCADLAIDRGSLCCVGAEAARRAVGEIARVLRPGGRLFLNPYAADHASAMAGVRGADGLVRDIAAGTAVGAGAIRFWSRADVDDVLAGRFRLLSVQHLALDEETGDAGRHAEWRVVAERLP